MKAANEKRAGQPLKLDSYTTRKRKLDFLNKKETIYAGLLISYISVVLFTTIDFACSVSSWTSVQNDNEWLVNLIAVGCAVCLDVPMAIAGVVAKEYFQKLRSKRESLMIVSLCIACFLIVWGFQIGFRLVTRDATFSENASTLVNTMSVKQDAVDTTSSGSKVLYAALYSAIIPFCTSIASFIVNFFGFDPLAIRIYRSKNVMIQTESNTIELKQALAEAKDVKKHLAFLIAYENDRLNAHIAQIRAEGELMKQVLYNEIKKHLDNPEQIAVVQKAGESATNEPIPPEERSKETLRFIEEEIEKERTA